jgi:hypothetical protein
MARMRVAAPARARRRAVPWLVGLAAGLLALGPALRPGYLLRIDMAAVPDPPLTGALLGIDAALPRAVPSDLVAALLAHVVPADAALKLLLLAAFTLAVAGAARLVPTERTLAAVAGGLCYAWNPWTAERMSMGHWAMLVGYAGLPWVAAAARRVATGEPRAWPALVVALAMPAIGGVSTCILAGVLVAAVLAAARARPRRWLAGVAALSACALPWLLPSLLHRAATRTDPAGVDAFALRPDGPFGPVGTAVQLAGVWNRFAVPGNRSSLVVQVAALGLVALAGWGLVRARARIPTYPALLGAGLLGLALAVLPTAGPGAAAMRAATGLLPAAAAMRDSHRWLALLALPLAVGFGAAVDALADRAAVAPALAPVAALALLGPLAVNPGLAWGLAGGLHPVAYPPAWSAVRAAVAADPGPGALLALPWTPLRDYPWSGSDLPVLTPALRIFERPVLWNDTVQVGGTVVAGESAAAADIGRLLAGDAPLAEPLRLRGIRFVLVETGRPAVDAARLGGTAVVTGPDLTLYRLAGPVAPLPAAVRAPALVVAGDVVALFVLLSCMIVLLAGKLRVRADQSDTNQSDTEQSDTEQRDTAQSSTAQSSTAQSRPEQSGTDRSGTDQSR